MTETTTDGMIVTRQSDDMLRGRIIAMRSMIAQFENEIKQIEGNLASRQYRAKEERNKQLRPTLADLLKQAAERVKSMTPEELEAMESAQRKSWTRQDND